MVLIRREYEKKFKMCIAITVKNLHFSQLAFLVSTKPSEEHNIENGITETRPRFNNGLSDLKMVIFLLGQNSDYKKIHVLSACETAKRVVITGWNTGCHLLLRLTSSMNLQLSEKKSSFHHCTSNLVWWSSLLMPCLQLWIASTIFAEHFLLRRSKSWKQAFLMAARLFAKFTLIVTKSSVCALTSDALELQKCVFFTANIA